MTLSLGRLVMTFVNGGKGNDVLFGDEDGTHSMPLYADGSSTEGNDELYGGSGADYLGGGGGDGVLWADAKAA